ncbi:MAG: hypothetical protein LBS99_06655 [Clostridiales bacterium]|jgi:hypothetical protein|nr:hypothetical protein [Clostridiales bacterium]
MKKKKCLRFAPIAVILAFAVSITVLPGLTASPLRAKAAGDVIEQTLTDDGWGFANIGANIATGLYGDTGANGDKYIVYVDAAAVDLAYIIKVGYSEWGVAHPGVNVTYRPAPGRDRVAINAGVKDDVAVGSGSYANSDVSADEMFYFNSGATSPSVVTFENFDFTLCANGMTSATGGFAGSANGRHTLIMNDCTLTDYRYRSASTTIFTGNASTVILNNSQIYKSTNCTGTYNMFAGGTNQNYMTLVLTGGSTYDGNISNVCVYDYRDLTVSLDESAGGGAYIHYLPRTSQA